jgi:DNA mismatch endonuclease (patch repair protein)
MADYEQNKNHKKEYYKRNRDKYRKKAHESYIKNPEKVKKRVKEWYLKNKNRSNMRVRKWKEEHPDRIKEYARKSRMKNKIYFKLYKKKNDEKINKYQKEWRLRNTNKIQEYKKIYYRDKNMQEKRKMHQRKYYFDNKKIISIKKQKYYYKIKGYEKRTPEELREYRREKRLNQIFPVKDTIIEKLLQEELTKRGYIYMKHYPIRGQPDIAFPEKKIAIFADGDYIHGNPNKYKATDMICMNECTAGEKWNKDRNITDNLQKQGWLVLRYWETEIHISPKNVVDEIEDVFMVK